MSERVETFKTLWNEISPAERAELFAYFESQEVLDEPMSAEEWQEAWVDEINRRIEAYENGESTGMPADEFMAKMKEKYG